MCDPMPLCRLFYALSVRPSGLAEKAAVDVLKTVETMKICEGSSRRLRNLFRFETDSDKKVCRSITEVGWWAGRLGRLASPCMTNMHEQALPAPCCAADRADQE